jgi:hypothetical protein
MRRYFLLFVLLSIVLFRSASAQILAEDFRNTGCVNCIEPDQQYENFISTHPNLKIFLVYIHNNVPSPNDPFYALSKADVNARQNLYNPIGDPEVYIGGYDGGNSSTHVTNWENLSEQPPQYSGTLTASASIGAGDTLQIDLHASGSSAGVQVKPYIILVESGIKFANTDAYGNPTDSIWNNIFRATIPASQGGAAFTLSGPQDFHFTYAASGKPWNLDNCKLYAFLQEVPASSGNSHPIDAFTIASITKADVKNSNGGIITSIEAPVPNPSQSFAKIPFRLSSPANVKITICDDLGREVATVLNQYVSETQSSAIFAPNKISRGVYYARMYAEGVFIGTQKIIFTP